jgi:CheY-like chemotaxis protein
MAESKALGALFAGPRCAVLSKMFEEPARWWSMPELAGVAGAPASSVRQCLFDLCEGGVVRQKENGGRASFQLDPCCAVYAELRAIFDKLNPRPRGGETILVVEDQPATAQITRILLESWGYSVIEAHNATEAICAFEQAGGRINLLLTDVIMPGMNGPELAEELRKREPALRVVLMSGYSGRELTNCGAAFLPKPFNPARLSEIVRRELDR